MKPAAATLTLLLLPAFPLSADFAVGGELMEVSRSFDTGTSELDSTDATSASVFLGFNWKNSMFYVKLAEEDSVLELTGEHYLKDELSFDWHWNETASKRNFLNTSLGLHYISYEVPGWDRMEFLAVSGGGGVTRFLAGPLFVNGRGRLRLAAKTSGELFPAPSENEDQQIFLGYEAQVALGLQLGRRVSWSVQAGYRFEGIEFADRFFDDETQRFFLAVRFFVPFGSKG